MVVFLARDARGELTEGVGEAGVEGLGRGATDGVVMGEEGEEEGEEEVGDGLRAPPEDARGRTR